MVVTSTAGKVAFCAVVFVVGTNIQRVASGINDGGGVAGGHSYPVCRCFGDCGKAEHCGRKWLRLNSNGWCIRSATAAGRQAERAQAGHRHCAYAALEHVAAVHAQRQNVVHVQVAAGVVVAVIRIHQIGNC